MPCDRIPIPLGPESHTSARLFSAFSRVLPSRQERVPDVPPPASVPQPAFVDVNLQQQGHVDSAQMSASSVGEHILGMPSMPVQQGTLGMPADDIDTAAGNEQHPRGRLFLRRAGAEQVCVGRVCACSHVWMCVCVCMCVCVLR